MSLTDHCSRGKAAPFHKGQHRWASCSVKCFRVYLQRMCVHSAQICSFIPGEWQPRRVRHPRCCSMQQKRAEFTRPWHCSHNSREDGEMKSALASHRKRLVKVTVIYIHCTAFMFKNTWLWLTEGIFNTSKVCFHFFLKERRFLTSKICQNFTRQFPLTCKLNLPKRYTHTL